MRREILAEFVLSLCLFSIPEMALAHHSFAANFDLDQTIEVEGTIQSVVWRNPHVKMSILVGAGTDAEQLWDIESHSLSNLHRMQVNRDMLVVGDTVKLAGPPALRRSHAMFMFHMLLEDGREVIFQQGAAPHFAAETIGTSDYLRGEVQNVAASERPTSIFSVWTTDYSNPGSWPLFPKTSEDHPLTDAARAKMAEFDVDRDDPLANCAPKGMPSAMAQPYPIELVDAGGKILLKIEEYDAIREIHVSDVHDDAAAIQGHLGYSSGRWDGDTLIVTTSNIDFAYLDVLSIPKAIPQSPDVHVVETFTLREGGSFLDYTMRVTDPVTLTEPMTFAKYWQFRPGATVEPFECDGA